MIHSCTGGLEIGLDSVVVSKVAVITQVIHYRTGSLEIKVNSVVLNSSGKAILCKPRTICPLLHGWLGNGMGSVVVSRIGSFLAD